MKHTMIYNIIVNHFDITDPVTTNHQLYTSIIATAILQTVASINFYLCFTQ